MVQAAWRLRRARSIENSLIEIEMLTTGHKHPEFADIDFIPHLALAFKDLSESSNSLNVLNRYIARLGREFHRALKTLRQLQADRTTCPPDADVPAAAITAPPAPETAAPSNGRVPSERVIPFPERVSTFLPNEPDPSPVPLAPPPDWAPQCL